MSKKIKLNLESIKVKSFVTSLDEGEERALKGGGESRNCPSGVYSGCPCPTWGCTQNTDCGQATCADTCTTCTCWTVCGFATCFSTC